MSQENAYRWTRRAGELYETISASRFESCCQFNICADGSTHGTKDILISLMYSHAEDVGCVARIQHMPIGPLLPSEVHDISALATLAKKSKLSRFAAFRQLQAMSHQLSLLTNGAKTLSSFVRAKACRPIHSGEHRVVIPVFEFGANDKEVEDDHVRQCVSRAFICQDGGTQLPVLPEEPFWWEKVPILVAWTRDRLEMRGWRLRYRTTWFMSSLTRSIDQSGTTNWRLGERAGVSFCAHSCTRAMSSA